MNKINEDALSNLLVDVDFLESEFRKIGHGHLNAAFQELRTVRRLVSRTFLSGA